MTLTFELTTLKFEFKVTLESEATEFETMKFEMKSEFEMILRFETTMKSRTLKFEARLKS